jgi:hypothetical protein
MWYQKWIPYFDIKFQSLQVITNSYEWNTNITSKLWSKDTKDTWNCFIPAIVSGPCLARWDSQYRWYIQTEFCSLSMAFVGMQPAQDSVSMTAMLNEMKRGLYKFLKDPPAGSLPQDISSRWPDCFGSRKCKGYKLKLHSWKKCHYYLWDMRNTWITDQYALVFLRRYDNINGLICQ